MPWTRRQILTSALGAGGVLSTAGLLSGARASLPTKTDRYFVFAYFKGGWDTLLSLDPRDPDVYTDEAVSETGIQPGYEHLQSASSGDYLTSSSVSGMTFGPHIGRLVEHAEQMAVVRGMVMGSVAHNIATRHALTGRLPAGTTVRCSSLATVLAAQLGSNETIPHLAGGVSTFNVGDPLWASGVSCASLSDLHSMLLAGDPTLLDSQRDALEQFFAAQRDQNTAPMLEEIFETRLTARSVVEADIASLFDLDALPDLAAQFHTEEAQSSSTGAEFALMAYQALTSGISRCVSFAAGSGLDAHSEEGWQADHGPRLEDGFNAVADLASALAATPYGKSGGSWLDHTTIVLCSEFGRGATLNSAGGRDHGITNAVALLGGGIAGGQVIGASSEVGMEAQAVDLSTGAVDEDGTFLTNEHIARTLLTSIGITEDIVGYQADPIPALLS